MLLKLMTWTFQWHVTKSYFSLSLCPASSRLYSVLPSLVRSHPYGGGEKKEPRGTPPGFQSPVSEAAYYYFHSHFIGPKKSHSQAPGKYSPIPGGSRESSSATIPSITQNTTDIWMNRKVLRRDKNSPGNLKLSNYMSPPN